MGSMTQRVSLTSITNLISLVKESKVLFYAEPDELSISTQFLKFKIEENFIPILIGTYRDFEYLC